MKKIIVTNNKKVMEKLDGKVQIEFYSNANAIDILQNAKKIAEQGGKLLIDPTRVSGKTYYRSLPFLMDGKEVQERSVNLIEKSIQKINLNGVKFDKEPVLAGFMQNKDLDIINKVVG